MAAAAQAQAIHRATLMAAGIDEMRDALPGIGAAAVQGQHDRQRLPWRRGRAPAAARATRR